MAWDNEKKKVKTAVAVAYEPGDKAPKILASGRGEVAEKIIAKAKENDVPFYKDNKLAETLSKLEIGDAIPPELYEVVAEILVFVDDMDKFWLISEFFVFSHDIVCHLFCEAGWTVDRKNIFCLFYHIIYIIFTHIFCSFIYFKYR
jgi:flagellar biosynthesis protein